jgi:hypothetical protein|tara:strand:+ start:183 stop:407 length:225 start_codon:yes stop_codon:yes gene_type:complete
MNLVPRIEGSKLIIFDANNGSIQHTAELPGSSTYSGPIVTGDNVTVTIHPKNGGKDKIRVYNLKGASFKREINL